MSLVATVSRRRFIAAGAMAACLIAAGSAAQAEQVARPDEYWGNVPTAPDPSAQTVPAAIPAPAAMPAVFRIRIHGSELEPFAPDGCQVEFRSLPADAPLIAGEYYFLRNHTGRCTFRRLSAVHGDELILKTTNRNRPPEIFTALRSEVASIAVATGVIIPLDAQKKSGSRNRQSRLKLAGRGTQRAIGSTAA
jgi:hypothetical protein